MSNTNRIKLFLKSFDHRLLDGAVRQIVVASKKTGAQVVGPIPLPNKRRLFTVLRSPHVNKKARDQFELVSHKRVIYIVSPKEQTMNELMGLNLSAGVGVEIN
jgi:small subunit ribosomal protein S10